jgi:uncharacterized membrane protein
MDTATQVLVIIVSATLTIFLIALIVLIVLAIKLMKQLKLIADRAEKAVDSVTTAGDLLRNASGPLAIAKLVRNLVKHHNRK